MKKFAAILAAMVLTLGGAAMTVTATDTQIPDTSVTAEEGIADGIYTMSAEMIQLNKTDKSMANEAIDHTVILEVENGECYITVTFKSLKFLGQEGYLQSLSYFDAGYEISQYGKIILHRIKITLVLLISYLEIRVALYCESKR
ncbi:NEAT domain-containing protein [Ruminococcus albus]|uniref:Iron transport-associated domain protein n=1 Tax=Ruminococcus albus 8 TaxID=246199 RepID=E9SG20_RUMAL|nr:NEAT domain-containing protein [Ruminococcus albus]EGC01813.1 iron transport-associated domain protein [Ruminococcus albus 8]MCC3352661.1 NEAT domain-containing protein [Ruminococcus albus 8]